MIVNATDFDNIEDVEIGPDGYIYVTSKATGQFIVLWTMIL